MDSFAGIMDAARRGTRIPLPGIPAFVNPIIMAQKTEITHWRNVKSIMQLKLLNHKEMSIKDRAEL